MLKNLLTELEIPVQFTKKLEDVKVKEKETAIFTCETNKENAQVKWFKSGTEISSDDKKYKFVTNGNKYSLEILDSQLNDIGEYTISLRGKRCSANLDVERKFKF
jgi:hypothetical protein